MEDLFDLGGVQGRGSMVSGAPWSRVMIARRDSQTELSPPPVKVLIVTSQLLFSQGLRFI